MTSNRKLTVLAAFVTVFGLLALLIAVNLNASGKPAGSYSAFPGETAATESAPNPNRVARIQLEIQTPTPARGVTVEPQPCTDLVTSSARSLAVDLTLTDTAGEKQKASGFLRVRDDLGGVVAAKRPYALTLNEKTRLLNLPKSAEWALLDGFDDRSLLRTITAMELANRVGFDWAPRLRPATLEINGSMCGLYSFGESITNEPKRLNLADGDIRLVADSGDHDLPVFKSLRDLQVFAPGITKSELADAKQRFQRVENVLYAPRFPDNNYRDVIDVDSFIDWYLLNELTKNLGSPFKDSIEMTLKADGTLAMGAPWDFATSQGNRRYGSWGLDNPKGWWLQRYWYDISEDPAWRQAFSPTQMWNHRLGHYYNVLMSDPAFANDVAKRWSEVSGSVGEIGQFIDETAEPLDSAVRDNFSPREVDGAALPVTASFLEQDPNVFVFANTDENIPPIAGWQNEVALLHNWLAERIAWLDEQFTADLEKSASLKD